MATYLLSVPTSIVFEVEDTELQGKNVEELTEDDVAGLVADYFGKWITIDIDQLGFENYTVLP